MRPHWSAERIVELDARAVSRPDLATVDHLCRMAFHARRLGLELRLNHVPSELHELLDLVGVCDVCGCAARVAPDEATRE